MNAREKSKIEYALNCYKYDRNILVFVETINTVLDTPAKKTLWFHILPLLDEDDQEYCKRRLFLATGNVFSLRSHSPSCLSIFQILFFFLNNLYYYSTYMYN